MNSQPVSSRKDAKCRCNDATLARVKKVGWHRRVGGTSPCRPDVQWQMLVDYELPLQLVDAVLFWFIISRVELTSCSNCRQIHHN